MSQSGDALIEAIQQLLPQTQCGQCGHKGCAPYAAAIVREGEAINRCPPGGAEGSARLAALTGRPALALDPACGVEALRGVALIDAARCIGCTLCIQACPVDAIVGTAKRMHDVIADLCTGCALCLPPCPVDCIEMSATLPDGANVPAWTDADARAARRRFDARMKRLDRIRADNERRLAAKAATRAAETDAIESATPGAALASAETLRKRATIAAAIERARQKAALRDGAVRSAFDAAPVRPPASDGGAATAPEITPAIDAAADGAITSLPQRGPRT